MAGHVDDDVHVADDRSNDGAAEAAAAGVLGAKYLLASPLNRCAPYAVQTHLHSPITEPARTGALFVTFHARSIASVHWPFHEPSPLGDARYRH